MKTIKKKDGWWIEDIPECENCGPYSTKKEAEEDRVGLTRTERLGKRHDFWTTEKREK